MIHAAQGTSGAPRRQGPPARSSRVFKFDRRGRLTKRGRHAYALRVIRCYMRDYARIRRAGWNDPVIAHVETCAAIRLARMCELITESEAGRLVLRLMRIERAPATRQNAKSGGQ